MPEFKGTTEVLDTYLWRPSELALLRSMIHKRKIKPDAAMQETLRHAGDGSFYLLAGHEAGSRLARLVSQKGLPPAAADLDGAVGKVFDINPDGSFRFLKQDVQIDPDTGKGQAWFTAYLSKDTEFLQREERRNFSDLKEGAWRATLSGKLESGRFVVDKMQLNALPDQVKDDDPKLPRVLSIGDSISMNYEQAARENLKGIANYHRITDNCWSTARCISFVSYWMGDYAKPGRGWDLILFNSGLHDMKQKELGGAYAMPLDEYNKNLRIWIEQMKPTGATLMYVTTTPVQNDSGSARYAFRTKGAEDDFNKAAREVLEDYPEILICDLAGHIDRSPEFDNWRKGRDVHFWNAGEQVLVGKAVAESVKKALEVRSMQNSVRANNRTAP